MLQFEKFFLVQTVLEIHTPTVKIIEAPFDAHQLSKSCIFVQTGGQQDLGHQLFIQGILTAGLSIFDGSSTIYGAQSSIGVLVIAVHMGVGFFHIYEFRVQDFSHMFAMIEEDSSRQRWR